jgi:pimeloyl-ACP methyl ester carboxylesterase
LIEGAVELAGACVPQPLKGTFRFTRRPEAPVAASKAGIRWEPYTLRTDAGPIEAELGKLQVPERRADPASRRITIAFARLRSTSPSPGVPTVYLDGGPGGSGVGAAQVPALGAMFRELRKTGDVILLSQRGTGLSDRIGCRDTTPLGSDALTSMERLTAAVVERHAACASSLRAQGLDIEAYNTDENAADIEALRAALGAPRISLVGFSYGTHLALATLRHHGAGIARAVLIGTEGPDDTWKRPSTFDAQVAAIDAMLKADPTTRAVMGDFTGRLRSLLARTAATPLTVTLPGAGAPRTLQIGPAGLLYLLRRDIGDTNDVPWIPAFVYDTHAGNLTTLTSLLARRLPNLESGVQMMAVAMDCRSAASAPRRAVITRESERSIFGSMTNFPFPDVCAAARISPLSEAFRAPVSSAVPSLFISGTLDSNTPPAQAETVMRGFSNAAHLIVEGAGHESTLTPEVAARIVTFLNGGTIPSARLKGAPIVFRLPAEQ